MSRIAFSTQREEAELIVSRAVSAALQEFEFEDNRVEGWSSEVPQTVVRQLHELNSGYKFCCTCILAKKNQMALHVNSTCLWSTENDSFLTVQCENRSIVCVLSIFAILM